MALSYASYTGNGTTTDFTFPFAYISSSDIYVYVGGVAVSFTFINASAIRCAVAPPSLSLVVIKRITQKVDAPVNFTDGSVLLESDLDTLATWTLYVGQESSDNAASTLSLGPSGTFEAGLKRITGLAPGVSGSDAVVMDQLAPFAAAASASAATAATQAANAATSATLASTYAQLSLISDYGLLTGVATNIDYGSI